METSGRVNSREKKNAMPRQMSSAQPPAMSRNTRLSEEFCSMNANGI